MSDLVGRIDRANVGRDYFLSDLLVDAANEITSLRTQVEQQKARIRELEAGGWNVRRSEIDAARTENAALTAQLAEAKEAGQILGRMAAEAKAAADREMERVKACEHIADGDEGWENVRNLCPSTAAVARLRDQLAEAKAALTKYGDVGAFNALRDANARAERAEAEVNAMRERLASMCDRFEALLIKIGCPQDELVLFTGLSRVALQQTSPAAPTWRCADCGAEPPIECYDRTCVHYTPDRTTALGKK